MKSFSSFAAMATEFVEVELGMAIALNRGLERVAVKIENTAKSEIGVYQDAAGPFPAWPELADSTEEQKAKAGFPANSPLLATGDMQGSIKHETEGLEAQIGTDDDKAVFHEFGTSRMPARPFMGPAAFRNKGAIQHLVGAAVVAGFVGADIARGLEAGQIHKSLGYDFETENV